MIGNLLLTRLCILQSEDNQLDDKIWLSLIVSLPEKNRIVFINELLLNQTQNMNKITFHNRKRIVQEYSALFGCRRCICCELQYQPGYTCSQNTLLIMDCNHLVHRQCLKIMLRGRLECNWNQKCNLCQVLEFFDRSEKASKLIQITRSNRHRLGQFQIAKNVWGDVNDYFQLEESQYYEKFIHQVEKKGKYAYK